MVCLSGTGWPTSASSRSPSPPAVIGVTLSQQPVTGHSLPGQQVLIQPIQAVNARELTPLETSIQEDMAQLPQTPNYSIMGCTHFPRSLTLTCLLIITLNLYQLYSSLILSCSAPSPPNAQRTATPRQLCVCVHKHTCATETASTLMVLDQITSPRVSSCPRNTSGSQW